MDLKSIKQLLKRIFLRPEMVVPPAVIPEINCLEDLLEPVDPATSGDLRVLPPPVVIPVVSMWDKIRSFPLFALVRQKKIQIDTGLTVRQRVKRYNASMEGGHGIPEAARKD